MRTGRIAGATRTFVKPTSWDEAVSGPCDPLAIRDEVHDQVPCMRSAWFPTSAEIDRLKAGAPVYLDVVGVEHPVVALGVGDVDHGDGSAAIEL